MTESPLPDEPLDPDAALSSLYRRTSEKWRRYADDVLPSFIAEMDLPVADEVLDMIGERIARGGDLGYAHSYTRNSPAQRALTYWLARRFGWFVEPDCPIFFADVMRVVETGIDIFSEPGDAVVTDVPAYPSFFEAVRERGRELVGVHMRPHGGHWRVDLDGIERAFRDGARIYLLCNPHNPTGRVHTVGELTRITELAHAHGVTVLADEVHNPLVYQGSRHIPFAALPSAHAVRTVTGVSASKGWNIAGLKCAFGIPGDAVTAEALRSAPPRLRDGVGILGVAASTAAFTAGDRWLVRTLDHLDGNRYLLGRLLADGVPEIGYRVPQATYLGWLDCRRIADRLGEDDLAQRVLRDGRLAVTDGVDFGCPGFIRLNFATTRALVAEQVRRLATALGEAAAGTAIGLHTAA